jgi:hypothetical protein
MKENKYVHISKSSTKFQNSKNSTWRQVLISCTVETPSQVYTKYTVLFSLASTQNLHEGPGLLHNLSILFSLVNLHQEVNLFGVGFAPL